MSEVLDTLPKRDRDMIAALAARADCRPEHIAAEILRAYLRLAAEVPEALPRNPLAPLVSNARARARKASGHV